jgi:hypothetical protein
MLGRLHDMSTTVFETRAKEEEQLAVVAVRHLIAYFRSTDQEVLLAPVHVDASEEAKATTKGDPKVDAAITKVIP